MSKESGEQRDKDEKILKSHTAQLMEHFESVQIFATRHMQAELGGTMNVQWGGGDWFARYGQIKAWTIKQDETFRIEARPDDTD